MIHAHQDKVAARAPKSDRELGASSGLAGLPAIPASLRTSFCACGGNCPACNPAGSNLPVTDPNDETEVAAEQMAERVMRAPTNHSPTQPRSKAPRTEVSAPRPQRKKRNNKLPSKRNDDASSFSSDESRGFDGHLRTVMEDRFEFGFDGVRIHTGPQAARLSEELAADAFTVGSDIFFGHGRFQPQTEGGQRLIAHELAHVVQQQNSPPKIQRRGGGKTKAPSASPKKKAPYDPLTERIQFLFRTVDEIPPAEHGAAATPFMIWCVKSAFNIDQESATRIVEIVGWVPASNTRKYRNGEWIEFTLQVSGVIQTLDILVGEGRVDAAAVTKFREIIDRRASMTERDREFFDKTAAHKFSNLDVDAFTVENLGKVQTRLDRFMDDRESLLRPLGLLDDYYRAEDNERAVDFEAVKDRFFGKKIGDLTDADRQLILSLFRDKAMRRVFQMLDKSNSIAGAELTRYTNKPQELKDLIALLKGTYGTSYTEADRIRVAAIYKFFDQYKPDYYTVPGGEMTQNFRRMLKAASVGEDELLQTISVIPSENIRFQLGNVFTHQIMRSGRAESYGDAKAIGDKRLIDEFPEFEEADRKDAVTGGKLQTKSTRDYPILYDLSLDFRVLSRLPDGELETRILDELRDKKDKSAKTQTYLLEKPWRIWEFQPLVEGMILEEGLSNDDVVGQVIQEQVQSVKDHKFWRSIGLAALGLALGIAGFFTAGATWVGIALIAGSVVVNLVDLSYELEDYALHSAAAEATFEGGLTNAPSSVGIIFAIGGLVLDFVDVIKLLKPAAKALSTADDVAKYAAEAFQTFKAAGKLKEGITEEMFVKQLVESWQKRQSMVGSMLPEIKAVVDGDAFKALHQGVQEGLFRVYDKDPEVFAHLIKTFGGDPLILTRLGAQAMVDPHAAEALADLYRFTKRAAPMELDDVLRYYGTVGERAVSSLPEVLDVLRRGKITEDAELTKLILTNRSLQQAVLNNAADPDLLLRQWRQFQSEAASAAADAPKTDFIKYLDENGTPAKMAGESAGIPQKVEFTADDVVTRLVLDAAELQKIKDLVKKLVVDKGFVSAEQIQAIIRTAESFDAMLAGTLSKSLRGFLFQLNNASTRIAKVGMNPASLEQLLRGLEHSHEFPTALKLVDHINTGKEGLASVDRVLSSMTVENLHALLQAEGAALKIGDVADLARKIKVTSNVDGEIEALARLAGESGNKVTDVNRLSNIVESMGEGPHEFDAIVDAIGEANVFDRKLAEAMADTDNVEALNLLVWGKKGPKKAGSVAYDTVFANPEKAQKLIAGVMDGTRVDPVRWAMLRKTIENANIDQAIKNNIIGELWSRAGIETYTAQGYKLFRREVPFRFKDPKTGEVVTANADAVMTKGDEILVLEFKSGEAVFSEGQEVIYPLIEKGAWANLKTAIADLETLIKADPSRVKFFELREPYN